MPRRFLYCWIFAVLILAGCSQAPVKQRPALVSKPQPTRRPPVEASVKSYGLGAEFAQQHLFKASYLLQSGDSQAARRTLDLLDVTALSPEQMARFNLLEAQIALSMGDAENAVKKLTGIRPSLLSTEEKIDYYQSLAFAHVLMGDAWQGINARLKLASWLEKPEQQQANIVAVIDMLSLLPESAAQVQPEMADELAGWMTLAKILKQKSQAGFDLSASLQQWRQDYPKHAANAEFLQAYLNASPVVAPIATPEIASQSAPQSSGQGIIAVLLPVSGSYAAAGQAIKAGVQAAQRVAASQGAALSVKFYDSAQEDIVSLYQQAVAAGAQQIIGPLVKEQIQSLATQTELSVPVLALNHVEYLNQPNLYQFGLSPMDEAEALVAKARQDGQQTALILVPNTQQGERIGHYLASFWQSHGGNVAGVQAYDPKQHQAAAVLQDLLAGSTDAAGQMPPRALLFSGSAEVARELAPQLKFQANSQLAVYAMPNVYAGVPNPLQDAELGWVRFCDIPWFFDQYYSGPLSQSALQSALKPIADSSSRLVALGIDAYNLAGHLPALSVGSWAGATGRLSLGPDQRVVRKLVCAQFVGGTPQASGFVE